MPTSLGQSMYRRGTKWDDESAPRYEFYGNAPLIFSSDRPDGTAGANPRTESGSPDGGFSRVGRGVFLANAKEVPEVAPTPSAYVDAHFRRLRGQSVKVSEGKSLIRVETMNAVPRDNEACWEELNERRLSLIDKDIEHGLSVAEKAELDRLEKMAEDYMNRFNPLPFGIIDRLKACAAKDGLNVSH